MSTYCDTAPGHEFHGPYHDTEYGFPLSDDNRLFERMALEIFQAGLSWLIVLKKRKSTFEAFDGFDIDKVASYGDEEVERLLGDAGIIRNRRKINAIVENAKRIQVLQKEFGSFAAWIDAHHPRRKDDWVKLCKKRFVFMGGEVVGEFLMSIGYLPGAHRPDCPIYQKIEVLKPRFLDQDPEPL